MAAKQLPPEGGNKRYFVLACSAILLILLVGELIVLPLPGIQQDEALFLRPFLRSGSAQYTFTIGRWSVPLMLMDYIGALKTWLYWPIFQIWSPGTWSIRLPACFLSGGTVVLFAILVRKLAGPLVAICSAALLATDASFVLTNVFDWGPVTLLIMGAVSFIALLWLFAQAGGANVIAAAFLLAGVMLWYKTIFAFPLAGIGVATVVVFHRDVRRRLNARSALAAGSALLIGAGPLLLFNVKTGGATIKANAYVVHTSVGEKLMMLRLTLGGKALEHYMFRSMPSELLPLKGAPLGELVQRWYASSQFGPGSLMPVGLLASLVALPFIRHSRLFPLLSFAWIAAVVTEILFIASGTGGAGPHHTVLLFPAPHFIVGATIVAAAERIGTRGARIPVIGAAILVVLISNVLLLERYARAGFENGFSVYWTDATRSLGRVLHKQNEQVAFLDWGIEAPARIESGDSIQVVEPLPARLGVIYVTHEPAYCIDGLETGRVMASAAANGFVIKQEQMIADTHEAVEFRMFSFGIAAGRPTTLPK